MTSPVVPFYAADQGICDTLCTIIRKLNDNKSKLPESFLTENEQQIFERIVKS